MTIQEKRLSEQTRLCKTLKDMQDKIAISRIVRVDFPMKKRLSVIGVLFGECTVYKKNSCQNIPGQSDWSCTILKFCFLYNNNKKIILSKKRTSLMRLMKNHGFEFDMCLMLSMYVLLDRTLSLAFSDPY